MEGSGVDRQLLQKRTVATAMAANTFGYTAFIRVG
jgi:hypothetical protein